MHTGTQALQQRIQAELDRKVDASGSDGDLSLLANEIFKMVQGIEGLLTSKETRFDGLMQLVNCIKMTWPDSCLDLYHGFYKGLLSQGTWQELKINEKILAYLTFQIDSESYIYHNLETSGVKSFMTELCVVSYLLNKDNTYNYNPDIKNYFSVGFTCDRILNIYDSLDTLYEDRQLEALQAFSSQLCKFEESWIQVKNYHEQTSSYEKRITSLQKNTKMDNELLILKRYNSIYPGVYFAEDNKVLGGGFYMRWKRKGIVIDPGYDFYRQLTSNGLSIMDIDYIFVTHAHDDHCRDLDLIFSLLHKRSKLHWQDRIIYIFGSENTCRKYHYLQDSFCKNIICMNEAKGGDFINTLFAKKGLPIEFVPLKAEHNEGPYSSLGIGSCHGLTFKLYDEVEYVQKNDKPSYNNHIITMIYTGDTRFNKNLIKQYSRDKPNIAILNIGTAKYQYRDGDGSHLGMKGCMNIIEHLLEKRCPIKLCIISEFGVEMDSEREGLTEIIKRWVSLKQVHNMANMPAILPGDTGLKINLMDCTVLTDDDNFNNPKDVVFEIDNGSIKYKPST